MKNSIHKKILSVIGIASIALSTPTAFAGTISVVNHNDAKVTNSIFVSARTGGNRSIGGHGAMAGHGGSIFSSGGGMSSTGGDGGMGGKGGDGGDIQTGDAISTAEITNDLNTTETVITDHNTDNKNKYNETLDLRAMTGSSLYTVDDESTNHKDNSSDKYSINKSDKGNSNMDESEKSQSHSTTEDSDNHSTSGNNNQNSNSSSYSKTSDSESESNDSSASDSHDVAYNEDSAITGSSEGAMYSHATLAEEDHDNLELHYTKTYVGGNHDDDISVQNMTSADASNTVNPYADTGGNESQGGNGGGTNSSGNQYYNPYYNQNQNNNGGSSTGGRGGNGGIGAMGGMITTGLSDSLVKVVTVSGRTVTRITR